MKKTYISTAMAIKRILAYALIAATIALAACSPATAIVTPTEPTATVEPTIPIVVATIEPTTAPTPMPTPTPKPGKDLIIRCVPLVSGECTEGTVPEFDADTVILYPEAENYDAVPPEIENYEYAGTEAKPARYDSGYGRTVRITTHYYIPNEDIQRALCEEVIRLTNEERAKEGLFALELDERLMETAKIRSEEIVEKQSHERPNGKMYWTVDNNRLIAENIAWGQGSTVSAVDGWMNSYTHYLNIMNRLEPESGSSWTYRTIGVGLTINYNEQYQVYWAQHFGE